ncbi:HAD-IB family phosphatase [Methylocucumis oryzae]|uniref:HAD-IB family phosphatase n=1 Tax=Methylocucumis oryzae TaxID=1632867 RepID=UPI000A7F8C38
MSFAVVCFDCDSTLSKIEGIDELAKRKGLGAAMAELTEAAMNGVLPLEAVYEQRLARIRPQQADMHWLAELYIAELVDGAVDVISALQQAGKLVHIISGGLRPALLPLAKVLGIDAAQVHAVDIYFNDDGSYHDFDRQSPLAKSGGKALLVEQLTQYGKLVMVGDGKTDVEAKQAGAFFHRLWWRG